jgi:hypothetical protein
MDGGLPTRRGIERMLRVFVVVNVLLVLVLSILIMWLHILLDLAFEEFVLVHLAEAHLRIVLVRVLIAILHDLIIVARRDAINLDNLHEHTSKFEFLAALQEECVRLLLRFCADRGRCLASARPGRLMHYASIVAALGCADCCTSVVGTVRARVIIASIAFSAGSPNVSGRVSALAVLIIRNNGLHRRLLRRRIGKLHLLDYEP